MDKELMEKIALESGLCGHNLSGNLAVNYHCNNGAALLVVLAKFAALVAEACAKEAEAAIDPEWPNDDQSVQAQNIAAAIRAKFPPVEGV